MTGAAFELYGYQNQSVDALHANFVAGIKRQMLCSPTGSGKTVIAMEIIRKAAEKGTFTIFVADRQILVQQTSDRFTEFGISHGILMGDQTKRTWNDTIIASAQTILSRGWHDWQDGSDLFGTNAARKPGLVVIDEGHILYLEILEYCIRNGIPLIALSATPFSPKLGSPHPKYPDAGPLYQAVVNVTTTTELLNQGFLCPVKVVGGPEADVRGLQLGSNGEWKQQDLSDRVMRITGDTVPEWERRVEEYFGGPRQTIVFCPSVADSEDMAEKFQRAGHDFRVLSYRQTPDQKKDIIDEFRKGNHVGLVSCAVLERGFDVPTVQVMVDAYPLRKAFSTHIQRLGRVMRIADGKEFALLICQSGNYNGFRSQMYAFFDEGVNELSTCKLDKTVRAPPEKTEHLKCRECGFIMPRREKGDPPITECPSCGLAIKRPRGKLEIVYGDLKQIDEVDGKGRDLPYHGDWWPHICAIACKITNDDTRAEKIALAKYRQILVDGQGAETSYARHCHPIRRWLSTPGNNTMPTGLD